ncbi:MAG TPA: UDP-N-acetylmuramoyl-tripeptide--D-alanyl-D-alanine ligase [Marinagarivorans sp.]
MKLSSTVPVTQGELIGGDCTFSHFATDSRTLKPGELFIALRGDNFDGHAFVGKAQAVGATAVVVEHHIPDCSLPQLVVADTVLALGQIAQLGRSTFSGPLIAITGSCGKTSVKGFAKAIFEQVGATLATQGNYNNHIGVPLTLNRLTDEHEFAVVEMGTSGVGEISYLAGLAQPDIALVNNIRVAHIGGFGSIDAIATEKGAIYEALKQTPKPTRTAIINLDDAFSGQYLAQTQSLNRIGFSVNPSAHAGATVPCLLASNITTTAQGFPCFTLEYQGQKHNICLQVLGSHFVSNALAASACALAAGVSLDVIASGLQQYTGDNGRMQPVAPWLGGQQALVINDAYNANPGSVRAAIDFLAAQNTPYRVLVLGFMGELGEGEAMEHTSVGLYALEMGITHLVAIGNLPRLAAEVFGDTGFCVDDASAAAQTLVPFLNNEATILLKGSHSAAVDAVLPLLAEKSKGLSPC